MFVVCRISMRKVVDELSMGQETQSLEQRSFAGASFAGVGGSSMSASAAGGGMMGTSIISFIRSAPLVPTPVFKSYYLISLTYVKSCIRQ